MPSPARRPRSNWTIPSALLALSLVPALAGTARLAELVRGAVTTTANARFFAMPLPIVLHLITVIPFTLLGALQFAPAFRQHYRTWHRASGRVLVVCGLIAALTGLWMTLVYPWPVGDGKTLYIERLIFGSAMLVTLLLAIEAIRRRNFVVHGEWMIRGYAIGMGAGTQVLTHLPYYLLVGKPDESSRAVLMGAGWVINVIAAEWIVRRGRTRARTSDSSQSAMRRVVLGTALLIVPEVASGQSHFTRTATPTRSSVVAPAIPRTAAGDALRAWIAAFNSADTARVAAYARRFEPDVVVTDELGFREQTGGFELVTIERSDRGHLEFIVRERKSSTTAYGVLDVSAHAPQRVTARRFQPLGPNVTAAALRIDAATRARTVNAAAALLDTFYVSPDVAKRAGDTLRARSASGAYRHYGNGVAFAMRLDDDLAALTHDKHLHLMYSVGVLPLDLPTSAVRTADESKREQERLDAIKCGFDTVEVLSGNVGYVKLDMFADLEFCAAAASAAMTAVAGTRALILDLRDNGGGEPAMVSYIASYLFEHRTHLNDLWTRRTGTTEEFWTRDSVPGARYGGVKPVCVLTSSRTFSGGEEFAYDLQQLQRAAIIGETTGGGAHPMSSHRIDDHFLIAVPFARPVNPVTHTSWEGIGVAPDVKASVGDALATALRRVGRAP